MVLDETNGSLKEKKKRKKSKLVDQTEDKKSRTFPPPAATDLPWPYARAKRFCDL